MKRTLQQALLLFTLLPATALAGEPAPAGVEAAPAPAAAAAEPAAQPASAAQPADGICETAPWAAASDADLAARSGGRELKLTNVLNQATSSAQVSSNSVGDGVHTGNIDISDAAISDVNGIFAGTFNSGNNVSIQTNLNVTINVD